MTAGKNKVNWSPKNIEDKSLTKTASTKGQKKEISDDDVLFEAAKSFIEASKENKYEDKTDIEEATGFDNVEDSVEDSVVLDTDEGEVELGEVSDVEVSEVAEGEASEAKAVEKVEKVEEAVEKVEEAVADLKSVVSNEEVAEEKVEDQADGDEVAEIEIEVVDEEPVSDEEGMIKESKPSSCEVCGSTFASSDDDFVRYAKLSPANRQKLRKYWKGMLNYVPDYVDLMTKDYE